MEQKKCPQCGTEFEGRSNRLYCSDSCKMRSFNQQKSTVDITPTAIRQKQVTSPVEPSISTAKLELETTRLHLAADEKKRQFEAEERQRERQYELLRQARQFDQEQQRAEAELDADKQRLMAQRELLLSQLNGFEDSLKVNRTAPKESVPEKMVDDKSDFPWGTLLLMGGGALLLVAIQQPQKPKLALQPRKTPQSIDDLIELSRENDLKTGK